MYYYFENVTILAEEVSRRDLDRKHVSLDEKASGDAEEMLVRLEAVGNLLGWAFLVGSLKERLYE